MLPTPDLAPLDPKDSLIQATDASSTYSPTPSLSQSNAAAKDLDLPSVAQVDDTQAPAYEKNDRYEKHDIASSSVKICSDEKTQRDSLTADEEWALDERNPRKWSFGKKWTMAGVVRLSIMIQYV